LGRLKIILGHGFIVLTHIAAKTDKYVKI